MAISPQPSQMENLSPSTCIGNLKGFQFVTVSRTFTPIALFSIIVIPEMDEASTTPIFVTIILVMIIIIRATTMTKIQRRTLVMMVIMMVRSTVTAVITVNRHTKLKHNCTKSTWQPNTYYISYNFCT